MAINRNFGTLDCGVISYAPSSFKTSYGIIVNPSDGMYLSRGYYRIIDEQPKPETGCYVKFNDYTKDDDAKTITFNYVQIMIPVTRETHVYSKLKLEMILFNIDKIQRFDDFLDQTYLSNDFGSTVALRKPYDQCQELKDDNEYFETYYKLAKEALDISDKDAEQILLSCQI